MNPNFDNAEQEGHRWRDSAISVAVVGAIIAVAWYSGHSPARQEHGVEPSPTAADSSAEVHDCIRAKRIEIVDDAGRLVATVQGIGYGKDAFAVLELRGYGAREGRMVRIDPQRVLISGDGGFTEVCATTTEWTAIGPSGNDDVMVRIGAEPARGSIQVKLSDSAIQSNPSQRIVP